MVKSVGVCLYLFIFKLNLFLSVCVRNKEGVGRLLCFHLSERRTICLTL